jgi:hypothetical protein
VGQGCGNVARHGTCVGTGRMGVCQEGMLLAWGDLRGRRSSGWGDECMLNRINGIHIPISCNLFSESLSSKNSKIKRA